MSHIPSNAMPHADESQLEQSDSSDEGGDSLTLKERAGKLATSAADLARDNPKTAIAAGAALIAGAVAAAAIPAARARTRKTSSSGSRSSAGSTSKKKKS
jgi:hypothetical protein